MKPVVKYVSTKENNFVDHYFLLSGIPINTHNTIVLMESLNSTSSKYSDAAFNPSAEDSETYKISFRATNHSQVYKDHLEIMKYINDVIAENISKIK